MTNGTERAAIYVRVSTASQEDDGTSLTTQEERCRQYAASRGYEMAGVFRDVFSGGVYRERPELSKLRALVREDGVDIVIAYAVDRLSRNQAHLYILAEEIDDHGARLEFVTEDFQNTPVGKFILSARAFAAEIEREKISERTQRGKRARAEAGLPIGGGTLPYGYRWKDDKRSAFDPDPETSVWVQRMFAWVLEGWTLRRIAEHLNQIGLPTVRKKALWGHSSLRSILTNPTYIGRREAFRYVQVKGRNGGRRMIERPVEERILLPAEVSPALVSEETFEAVQARLRRNQELARRNGKYPEEVAILRGFTKCGHCGGSLAVKRVGPGGKYFHYRCIRGMAVNHDCKGASIPTHILDPAVWERVESILTRPDIIAAEIERLRTDDPTAADVAAIDRILADIRRRQSNLISHLALFSEPEAAAPVAAQIEALRAQEKTVRAEREEILARKSAWETAQQHLSDLEAWCRTVAERLTTISVAEKRLALEALGVHVRVWRAGCSPRWEITMNIPIDIVDESSGASNHNITKGLVLTWTDKDARAAAD